MSYSLTAVLQDQKAKKTRIRIRLIINRKIYYSPTPFSVLPTQFVNGLIVDHPKQLKINGLLLKQISEIEDRLLEVLRTGANFLSKKDFILNGQKEIVTPTLAVFADSLQQLLAGKISKGRLKHYKVITNKIREFDAAAEFSQIDAAWLMSFETFIRKGGFILNKKKVDPLDNNTVLTNMSTLIGLLNKAAVMGYIKKDQFSGYRRPSYKQALPVYLTEGEIGKLFELAEKMGEGSQKLSTYYFLLSCYAGYRLQDSRSFIYSEMVENGQITIRATKNGKIISIPVHTRLSAILEYIKDKPITITDEHIRKYIKQSCKLVGIKKNVKFHSSRHSFAMLLRVNDFDIEEIAYLLGDSEQVAKVYAKMHDPSISKKIMRKLG